MICDFHPWREFNSKLQWKTHLHYRSLKCTHVYFKSDLIWKNIIWMDYVTPPYGLTGRRLHLPHVSATEVPLNSDVSTWSEGMLRPEWNVSARLICFNLSEISDWTITGRQQFVTPQTGGLLQHFSNRAHWVEGAKLLQRRRHPSPSSLTRLLFPHQPMNGTQNVIFLLQYSRR